VQALNKSLTYLGRIISVDTASIDIEIADDIPSAAPIINGKQYRIGQIGSLIRIPIGNINLYGIVSSVSNCASNDIDKTINQVTIKNCRHISANLLGEKVGNKKFQQGVGIFPTINDEVHIVTEEYLKDIYGCEEDGAIKVGYHSSSDNLPIYIDLPKMVLRHSCIVGSTGSGKSNATASILKGILNQNKGSRIILIDIHGEYSSAFVGKSKVFKISDANSPLYIPFWIMDFDELSYFLVGRESGSERPEDKRLRESIIKYKKENIKLLKAGNVLEEYITADSPIPFNIRKMWYNFNKEVYGTHSVSSQSEQNESTEQILDIGNYNDLIPAKFEPYSIGSAAPYKSKDQTMYAYEKKIYSRLIDNRYDFMFNPKDYFDETSDNDIDKLLREWISNKERLTILDLSGVPFELIDISVGLVTRLIYDSMFWGRKSEYTGRKRPLLMVYEEAHIYLPKNEKGKNNYGYARKAVEKIYKEGRKFGIGAMVVTQRPSEISETILSQTGTFISLRVTNSSDQSSVKSLAPNNMNSLIDLLPSLRTGEAIILGEAINIPTRIRFELVEPRPNSNDPDLRTCWQTEFISNDDQYKEIITAIREKKEQ